MSYTDTVAAGSYFYRVTAEDAAGNVGPVSNEASASVGDTIASDGSRQLERERRCRLGQPELDGGERRGRGGALQRAPGHDGRFHAAAWRTGSRSRPA